MEDRYLFRAKRTDTGEWVEGHMITDETDDSKCFIGYVIGTDEDGIPHDLDVAQVDPSTICQCTGCNDKNGKQIYENDIMVAYYDEENPEHGTYVMVAWREYGWVAVENNSDDPCPLDDFTIKHFEVVGNIFDNPELLEG